MTVGRPFPQRFRTVHDAGVKPVHKAVAQVDLKAGTVELF